MDDLMPGYSERRRGRAGVPHGGRLWALVEAAGRPRAAGVEDRDADARPLARLAEDENTSWPRVFLKGGRPQQAKHDVRAKSPDVRVDSRRPADRLDRV